MKGLGYIVATIGVWGLCAVFGCFEICKAWSWFIVTGFIAPEITMTTAIGLSMIVGYLTQRVDADKKDVPFGDTLIKGLAVGISKPLCLLFFGWIVTLFM